MNPGTYFTGVILGLLAIIGVWLIVEMILAVRELAAEWGREQEDE